MTSVIRAVAVLALAATTAGAQGVQPRALTLEEIKAQLKDAPKLAGQILLGDESLCSFDSDELESYAWRALNAAEPRPNSWVDIAAQPTFTFRLSEGDSLEHLLVTTSGNRAEPQMALIERVAASPEPAFRLRFEGSLQPANYEFAMQKGTIVLFTRCGFTVEESTNELAPNQ